MYSLKLNNFVYMYRLNAVQKYCVYRLKFSLSIKGLCQIVKIYPLKSNVSDFVNLLYLPVYFCLSVRLFFFITNLKCLTFQCEGGISVFNMVNALYKNPPYNMILGPACSVSTTATAEVSQFWNVTQVCCRLIHVLMYID